MKGLMFTKPAKSSTLERDPVDNVNATRRVASVLVGLRCRRTRAVNVVELLRRLVMSDFGGEPDLGAWRSCRVGHRSAGPDALGGAGAGGPGLPQRRRHRPGRT